MSKIDFRFPILCLCALAALAGCGQPSRPAEDPMTGDLELALAISQAPQGLQVGETAYVVTDRLRARSTPENLDNNIVDVLAKGDAVVISKILEPNSEFVGVTVPSLGHSQLVYIGIGYLTRQRIGAGGLFIIQNIATEKTRVYRNCGGEFCAHELILETENVVGDNTQDKRTWLGSYKITRWFKFYEDGDSKYPSWYHPSYVLPPLASAPISSWFDRSFMPHGRGEIRGGFGWYAAYVGPDASAQWIHGTYGWGANKKDFIQKTRSHGCTRLDNESVAYLRHLISVGTPVARVYAQELNKTAHLPKELGTWPYILTKDDAQSSSHYDSDRKEVLRRGIPKSRWLEEGIYSVNSNVSVNYLKNDSANPNSTIHRNGNSYEIQDSSFRGIFWVDHGRLENYQHPQGLDIGGYRDHLIPHSMIWNKK